MTGEVVNLRRVRKRLARRTDEENAAQNRVAFGIPKSLRIRTEAERQRDERRLDAHRRTPDGEA